MSVSLVLTAIAAVLFGSLFLTHLGGYRFDPEIRRTWSKWNWAYTFVFGVFFVVSIIALANQP